MRYKFFNINPLGEIKEDCVCRAISGALKIPYYVIENKLHLIGELFDCQQLCVCCYKHLLDSVYGLDRIEECKGMTVKEFLDIFNKGTYIIRVEGHLTFGCDGELKDIWNCKDEIIDIVWEVREY